jgi:hypothetical protein
MNTLNEIIQLDADAMKSVVGGNGSHIDPNGGTTPSGGDDGDRGGMIDPNG